VDNDKVSDAVEWRRVEPGSPLRPPEPPGGVAILLTRGELVLLGLRAPGKPGAGTWAPPGGKAEVGEDVETCARRELLEETGLVAGSVEVLGVLSDRLPDGRRWGTVLVTAVWAGGEPQVREPDSCVEWRWFPVGNLPGPRFRPFDLLVRLAGRLSP
jgi:8-oxo-dGTP diphosphatase